MKTKGCQGVVITAANQIIELIGFTIEQALSAIDSSVLGAGAVKEIKAGQSSWSGTIDVFYDPGDAGIANMEGALDTGQLVILKMYPGGDTSGLREYSGTALITGISTPVESDGMVQQSFTYEGSGLLTKGAVAFNAAFSDKAKQEHSA